MAKIVEKQINNIIYQFKAKNKYGEIMVRSKDLELGGLWSDWKALRGYPSIEMAWGCLLRDGFF